MTMVYWIEEHRTVLGAVLGWYTINLISKWHCYSIKPSISGAGNEGTRFPKIVAFFVEFLGGPTDYVLPPPHHGQCA